MLFLRAFTPVSQAPTTDSSEAARQKDSNCYRMNPCLRTMVLSGTLPSAKVIIIIFIFFVLHIGVSSCRSPLHSPPRRLPSPFPLSNLSSRALRGFLAGRGLFVQDKKGWKKAGKRKVKIKKHCSLSWREEGRRKSASFPLCLDSEPNPGVMINFYRLTGCSTPLFLVR